MFYQFNSFTGRLVGSNHMIPHFPVGTKPLPKNDPPKIMFETPYVKLAQETPIRRASQKKFVPGTQDIYSEVPEALKKKMELFQRADGVPIHLKGGPFDRILFGTTMALCGVGILLTLNFLYGMSYPKKKN
ncbi:hypothetical protein B566_EDAN006013 [Ephemera danica]|nr:hypothetical protein B566_EDAN006013 [Ephemera danica]